ncbi:MAG: DUF547 domain-containing protein [Rhodospirillales bacterium]|nr:DUF547 domain-containing protein [Rhodospirillales bacterium]
MRFVSWLVIFAVFPLFAHAAPDADLWPDWQVHDAQNTRVIDHGAWQDVLDRYVSVVEPGVTSFDYAAAKANGSLGEGDVAVAAYIAAMVDLPIGQFNRDQQLAYWINLYNALTVKVVLDHYPVASIRDIDISPGLFSSGPWGKKLITVEGRTLSLDDIEHRILRPIWNDPRIHYVVNCASIGCPALARNAYRAEVIDDQLDQAATDFINHPRAVRSDGEGGFVLSSLYDWYRGDFGKSDADFIAHLLAYAGADLAGMLGNVEDFDIARYEYDWALNAPSP